MPDGVQGVRAVTVRSYDLDEMLATKMRALLQREHGRDLFDLWRAWEHCKSSALMSIDARRVGQAFRFYMTREGSRFSSAQYRDELARRMQSRKFLRDLEGYLPIGMDYDPQAAYATFCEIFLPHIDTSV